MKLGTASLIGETSIANKINGRSITALKGKSGKKKIKLKRADMKCDVPRTILDAYGKIHININIM